MKPPSVRESVSESAAASVSASAVAPGARSCPRRRARGGLIDGHGRRIDYLRVSVTDRCDLRCTYRDYKGAEIPANWLSHEEMARLVRLFVDNGVRKVRLTGGEPLTRGGVAGLAAAIAAMPGLRDLSLSTNGTRLARHARSLRQAGVQRLNVSLDTLAYAREQGFVLRLIGRPPMGDCGHAHEHVDLNARWARGWRPVMAWCRRWRPAAPARRATGPPSRTHVLGVITPIASRLRRLQPRVRLGADGTLYLCWARKTRCLDACCAPAPRRAARRAIGRHRRQARAARLQRPPERVLRFMAQTGG